MNPRTIPFSFFNAWSQNVLVSAVWLCLGMVNAPGQTSSSPAPAYAPKKGFSLSLWAREPKVMDPVALNFDDQGRLYVAETARRGTVDIDIRAHPDWIMDDLSNQSVEDLRRFFRSRMSPERSAENARWLKDLNGDGSHDWRDLMSVRERIRLLEDPQHTGQATRSTVFYEGFHEEITGVLAGVFPWGEDVFATVYPDLWRMTDTAHTGQAASVESLFRGFGVHAAFDGHDLHGLVPGPDGKIYFSHGDNGFSVKTKEGRSIHKPNTGGVFRMNPDGSELELFAWGLRNVQEIAFDEFGNMFGVDNDGDLAGERERFVYITEGSDSGWRLHWQFKEQGWRRQTLMPNYNPWIQENMWVPHHPGQPAHITPPITNYSVGPSGFKYNPGTALNEAYRGSFFLAQFPVQKLTSFNTRPKGAGFEMVDEQVFLSGMMASAMEFGPDGAMYIADWDGMWNPDGKGAIWVLDDLSSSKSAVRTEVARLLFEGMRNRGIEELSRLLAHADMRIRLRAQFELVGRRQSTLLVRTAKDGAASRLARIHALWALGQLRDPGVAAGFPWDDADAELRAQSAKIAGDLRSKSILERLVSLLADSQPRVRFHAALALGKAGSTAAIPALVRQLELNNDTDPFLRHSCALGLAGIGAIEPLSALASHSSTAVRLGAIVALRRLSSPAVAAFLKDADPTVRMEAVRAIHDDEGIPEALSEVASLLTESQSLLPEAIARRAINASLRSGRAEDAARLLQFAQSTAVPEAMRAEALEALASWDRTPALDRVEGLVRRTTPRPASESKLGSSLIRSRFALLLESATPLIAEALTRCLSENSIEVDDVLLRTMFQSETQKPSIRMQALKLLAATKPRDALPLVETTLDSKLPELRLGALESFSLLEPLKFVERVKQRFDLWSLPEQQFSLAQAALMKKGGLDELIRSRLAKMKNGTLPRELELDVIEAARRRRMLPASIAEESSTVSAHSSEGETPRPKLLEVLYGGDRVRGEAVFRSHVGAQCVRCHDAGGAGKQAGPLLSGVASRATREYLLESLVNPSARIAPGFENLALSVGENDSLDGVKVSEDARHVIVRLADGEVRSVDRKQIRSISISTVSSMPSMLEVLTPFEIRDLVAYLAELK